MRIKLLLLLLTLGVSSGGICASTDPKSDPAAPPLFTVEQLKTFIDTYRALTQKDETQTCKVVPDSSQPYTCTIDIDLLAATATNGKAYCVAAIPSLVIIDDADHKHEWDIQWHLVHKTYAGPVHFHANHGILVLGPSQLKSPTTGSQEFHFKHANSSGSKTFYVPIIIAGNEQDDPGVCAAGDPKIVNN